MARANPSHDVTHIPPVVKQLAPYVKSRQEALQIRQALTSYLRSFIVFKDQPIDPTQSHLTLCAPTDAVADVNRIPADLPGLRKDYLKALAANVAARKEFASASENVASLRRQRTPPNRPNDDLQEPSAELRDYLALLRDRRRHAKLQVFQQYLEEIKSRDTGDLGDIGIEGEQTVLPEADAEGQNGTGTELDELVHSLERAVVRAKTQLDRQKQLFEKTKAQHDSRPESQTQVSPDAKAQALQRTRDELVQWVEERLVGQGDPDESLLHELPPEEIEAAQQELEDRKAQIAGQYTAYLQARRELLDAASRACQPVNVAPKPSSRPASKPDLVPAEVPSLAPIDVLSYANENLLPLSKSQKSLSLQKSYLSGLLSKEKSTTLRALNRLSDESHLLPEYPIQAPRAKHPRAQPQPEQNDEVVGLAEAWAFASAAADANGREYVQQKLALGTEVTRDARQTLVDVYGTLNQELDEAIDGQSRDAPISTRGLRGGSRVEKRLRGPWARLDGEIGLE
ncbi:uncharacterized protein N7529_000655 [Penicillium soppii]|uniref:uncharacterized protein n=1 Tax=Penicillium soppii TaxID=69789 RepID=UPI0025466103|nr:uncharacterized protein N7529_000655 [Penicillium soppii]KAJ5881983.1 hypothetical protein N7529_000655 [Penicillium soppii]